MGLSGPTSPAVPYRNGRFGKPRWTLLSEGNPFRRLLLGSNVNSLLMAVLLQMDCPSHLEGWNCLCLVPGTGLEPARLAALDPKSSASANSAIPARLESTSCQHESREQQAFVPKLCPLSHVSPEQAPVQQASAQVGARRL
jgi:hypothetical protein